MWAQPDGYIPLQGGAIYLSVQTLGVLFQEPFFFIVHTRCIYPRYWDRLSFSSNFLSKFWACWFLFEFIWNVFSSYIASDYARNKMHTPQTLGQMIFQFKVSQLLLGVLISIWIYLKCKRAMNTPEGGVNFLSVQTFSLNTGHFISLTIFLNEMWAQPEIRIPFKLGQIIFQFKVSQQILCIFIFIWIYLTCVFFKCHCVFLRAIAFENARKQMIVPQEGLVNYLAVHTFSINTSTFILQLFNYGL